MQVSVCVSVREDKELMSVDARPYSGNMARLNAQQLML